MYERFRVREKAREGGRFMKKLTLEITLNDGDVEYIKEAIIEALNIRQRPNVFNFKESLASSVEVEEFIEEWGESKIQ